MGSPDATFARLRALRCVLLAAGAAACGRDAAPPQAKAELPPGTLGDAWWVMQVDGEEVGYSHARSVRRGGFVETASESVWHVSRAGAKYDSICAEVFHERATDGALVHVHMTRSRPPLGVGTETDVRLDGAAALVSTTVLGKVRESAIGIPSELIGPYRITELARGLKPGARVEARTLVPTLTGVMRLSVTAVGEERTALLDGRSERLLRVETTYEGLSLKRIAWMDTAYDTRKIVDQWGEHAKVVMYLVTEDRARRESEGDAPSGFPWGYLTPYPILCPRRLDRATYVIRSKSTMPPLADDRQSVERRGDGTVVLRVARDIPSAGHTGARPLENPPPGLALSLAPSSIVQSDAPEIVAIAQQVLGPERDAWNAARKLERWVNESVRGSDKIDFGSALEVARDRVGDCTEYAVLLCALCRAAGVPARLATGVIGLGNEWGLHAWTEVWIDGRWYALDGTLGEGSVDPAHIAVSRLTLEDTRFSEPFLATPALDLEIDAVEVEVNSSTVRRGEDPVRVDGRRYENRVWGISFTCPSGWTYDGRSTGSYGVWYGMRLWSGNYDWIAIGVLDTARDHDWDRMQSAAWHEPGRPEEMRVDGRRAFRVRDGTRVYALGAKAAFVFDTSTEDLTVFDAFLRSVELDIE